MTPLKDPQRRRFLRTLGAGGALAGGAGLLTPMLAQAEPPPPPEAAPRDDDHYRESAHVRAYYASLRD